MTSGEERRAGDVAPALEVRALEIRGLSAGYGRFDVVHDLGLDIAAGEAVGLLGPNGAGKTTVLRSIMGMVPHRRGEIRIGGRDVSRLPAHRVARGYAALVPEGRRLFLNQSVEDNLRLGGMRHRRDPARTAELMQSVVELFPVVERYLRRSASALSGGEQQMVAIGRMMMNDPQLMLLDEPSLGLAPLAIADMARALVELRRQGRSLLLVEQRVDLAVRVCDRLYVLADGRIVDEKATSQVVGDERALIDAYLG
ncbi:MAG TPA: ABC transporter ATP-binding protein [Acidimicrobiales bacterium]|nr:ABC transporter ATP-binding protein [Acidimicrobiales bacterium]